MDAVDDAELNKEENEKELSYNVDDNDSIINLEEMISHLETTSKPNFNETKSLFKSKYYFVSGSLSCTPGDAFELYQQSAEQRRKQWIDFLSSSARVHNSTPATGVCKPSNEQQAYLDQGRNLQNFIRESVAFMKDATIFVDLEHEEMIELGTALTGDCVTQLMKLNSIKLAENLANQI